MSEDVRRLKQVQAAIDALLEQGATEFRPGDVASYQRNAGEPIPVWEIRGLLTQLAEQGLVELDAGTGAWRSNGGKVSASAG